MFFCSLMIRTGTGNEVRRHHHRDRHRFDFGFATTTNEPPLHPELIPAVAAWAITNNAVES